VDFHANRRAFPAEDAGQLERLCEPLQLPGIFCGKGSPVCVEIHGRRGIESGWRNSGIWRHGNGPTESRAHPTSALGRLRSPDPDAFRSMKLTLWVMIELKVSESAPG